MYARVTPARERASEASEEGKSDRAKCIGQPPTLRTFAAIGESLS